jgi:hypothetical protein
MISTPSIPRAGALARGEVVAIPFLLWKAPQIPVFISDALLVKPAAASVESQSAKAAHMML